jgi:hypothetical protein
MYLGIRYQRYKLVEGFVFMTYYDKPDQFIEEG